MVYYYNQMMREAWNYIGFRGDIEDQKAAKDLWDIEVMISRLLDSEKYMQSAQNLDDRLYEEYSQIQYVYRTVKKNRLDNKNQNNEPMDIVDCMIKNLRYDKYGILACVLERHGKVEDAFEMLECVVA